MRRSLGPGRGAHELGKRPASPNRDEGHSPARPRPGDGRILSAAWRDGRLVASQTEQANQHAVARWYEFSTLGATPTLTQTFEINRGPGVATFMPSINIAPNGDLAMTFLESSATEFLSMYLAGQKAGAPAGTFQGPVLARSGEATLRVFRASGELGAPLRTGDYSGVAIDPTDGSFWAANEYTTTATFPPPPGTRLANWGTWIAHFTISNGGALAAVALGQPAATPNPLVLADPIIPGGTTNGGSQASLPATALSSSSSNVISPTVQPVGITSGTASTTALDNYFAHDQDQHQELDWTDGLTATMPW